MRPSLLTMSWATLTDTFWPHGRARQAPLSMGFSRQEYWSGLTFPSPRDLEKEILPRNQTRVSCIAGRFFTIWAMREAQSTVLQLYSAIISSNIFSGPSSLLLLGPLYCTCWCVLMLSQRSRRLSSLFSFWYSLFCGNGFHRSVFQVTYPFFCLSYSNTDCF